MNVTIPVYQRKRHHRLWWQTLGLGAHNRQQQGRNAVKLQQELTRELKQIMREMRQRTTGKTD